MKTYFKLAIVIALSVSILAGCNNGGGSVIKDSKSITVSGSTTLQPLVEKVAELYKITNPDISIAINGGGSEEGLKNVLAGTVDIGDSDVYAEDRLAATDAAKLTDNKICVVGVGVVLSNDMASYSNLTKAQLQDIFTGKIKNWKDVDGPNQPIVIVNRPVSSGTRSLFVKWALDGKEIIEGDLSMQTDDSNVLAQTISATKGAIGYLEFPYINTNLEKVVPAYIDGIEPSNDSIYSNTYPIWEYEHMYINGVPNPTVKKFLEFMKSTAVESQLEELGYGAISKLNKTAAKSR